MHRQLDLDRLFGGKELDRWIAGHEHMWKSKVDDLPAGSVTHGDHDALASQLAETYAIVVAVLGSVEVDQEETTVDMSRDTEMTFLTDHEGGPLMVKGTVIAFHVPFEGDRDIFDCAASTRSGNPPRATVASDELHLSYFTSNHDGEGIRQTFSGDLERIREGLKWAEPEVAAYMNGLRERILQRLHARKEKLGKDQSLAESIGFPIRRRENAPTTYVAPTVRRRAPVQPKAPPAAAAPDPTLELAEYEHILNVCSLMVSVIERSPSVFAQIDEEALRTHFLVQLNSQYEGGPTAETFNGAGKTDILIRSGDRNIFIAECKFWDGPKSLKDAIDQLLSYATWRDTKTAIFVFNRSRRLSHVLEQVPAVVEAHPAHVRRVTTYSSETGFRFVLKRLDDPSRELLLTVLVFEVPS